MSLKTGLRFLLGVSVALLLVVAICEASPRNFPVPVTKPDPALLEKFHFNAGVNQDNGLLACSTKDRNFSTIDGLSGRRGERYRWTKTDGFTYQVDSSFNDAGEALIDDAMYELSQVVCIPFNKFDRGSEASGDYVLFQSSDSGCYSNSIGRLRGKQIINLNQRGCMSKGIAMHEAIHALGFNHEQTRPDRDEYITVFEDNIVEDARHNYKKYEGSLTFGVPYDFRSIMHYGDRDFAIDRNEPTMAKLNGGPIKKQRDDLTSSDVEKLRKMYKC